MTTASRAKAEDADAMDARQDDHEDRPVPSHARDHNGAEIRRQEATTTTRVYSLKPHSQTS